MEPNWMAELEDIFRVLEIWCFKNGDRGARIFGPSSRKDVTLSGAKSLLSDLGMKPSDLSYAGVAIFRDRSFMITIVNSNGDHFMVA